MDVLSVLVEEQSGVTYHDFEENETDIFRILSDADFNYIRLRVWNDPYDKDGHRYAATITSQGKMLHDIIQAVNEVNGISVFY